MNAPGSSSRRSQRSAIVHAGGRCGLQCAVCDCTAAPSRPEELARSLEGGGARLLVRGATESSPAIAALVGRAREEGFSEVVLRTNATTCRTPEGAAAFARLGGDAVLVPFFSHLPVVHDRISGRPNALREALTGLHHLAAAGLGVEVEIPLLDPRLQKPEALVRLLHRAVPSLRSVRFFLPPSLQPESLTPPPWPLAAAGLAAGLMACRELGIAARLTAEEGVPLCALREFPDLHDAYAFNPRARTSLRPGSAFGPACEGCATRAQCPGLVTSYRARHGDDGLAPYARKPKLMYEQRTTRRRVWTPEQRTAASGANLLVLRPTVNCNQDCTFCSANETSANVWGSHEEMLRVIARAARRSLQRLSFSGGEPTLSKHLPEYVRCASRLGVPEIELVTNAVLLDRPEKVATLAAAGLTHAFVSLHAHNERLSQQSTQKVGDFARTVQGVKNLLAAGVRTALNHVITARNYPFLREYVDFVRREFDGKVKISFAFVTPQFKALDNIEVMPRLSDVMPYLKRALYHALDIGQPFTIGSRQGIPFCFLDEFRAWSDGLSVTRSALSEDAPQKQRDAACDECRYSPFCVGLWRPYVAKYGFAELRPVPGDKLTEAEANLLRGQAMRPPWGIPNSFEEIPEPLRARELESGPPPLPVLAGLDPTSSLPEFVVHRTRPLRLALLGSGRQARRLARAARQVAGLSIDAVASPHAPQSDLHDFGNCPAYADAAAALEDIRPEGVIIAAATEAHAILARLAVERGIPVLLEKPLTRSLEEAEELRDQVAAAGAIVVPAHNSLHAPGLDEVLSRPLSHPVTTYLCRRTPGSPDAMRTWNRSFLYETIYHLLAVVGRASGGGEGEIAKASYRGEARPERFRIELRYGEAVADVTLDFTAPVEEDVVSRRERDEPASEWVWRRQGRDLTIREASGVRQVEADGNDSERMLANFRDVVLGKAAPGATVEEAIDIMRTARKVVEAIVAAGAPFERPNAPRHVASRALAGPGF